jgi:hypothetical protein
MSASARANLLAAEREAQELGLLLQQQLAALQLDDVLLQSRQSGSPSSGIEHMQATEELRAARVREAILRRELASCDVGGYIPVARADERDPRAGRAGEAVRCWRHRVETQRQGGELASRAAAAGLMEDESAVTFEQLSAMLAALHDQTAGELSDMARELDQAREDAARLASIAVTAQAAALQLLHRCGRGRSERLDALQAAGGLGS